MVGWPQIPGPVVRHLGGRLGGTDLLNSCQLDRRGWWQKGARASVSYPLNACPTDLPCPVSFLLPQPLLTSHQLLNQPWAKPLMGPELSWSNGLGNTLTDTLKCTLKIFYSNSGKQGQGDKTHRFFSEPFLFSNIVFFPQKGKAHLVILTNKL